MTIAIDVDIALACLVFVSTSTVTAAAGSPSTDAKTNSPESAHARAESADRGDHNGRFELRAGGELTYQSIQGFRDYSLAENGIAYGGFAAGLANVTGRLWVGTGASFAILDGEAPGISPYGSIGGWLLHWPLLVELGFPITTPQSRVVAGLELGGMWGKLTNVHQGHLTDPTVNLRGFFLGLRGGYALPIAADLALGALLGARFGRFDQIDQDDPGAYTNQGLIHVALVFQLALHFQP